MNDFFANLIKACRDSEGQYELVRWWNEKRCKQAWKGIVTPDGLGELSWSKGSVTFLLELDRGTERGQRLAEKLVFYRRFGSMRLGPEVLLFLFPSLDRELHARRALESVEGLSVATSYREAYELDPLGPVWLPVEIDVSDDTRRRRVTELASRGEVSGDRDG